MTRSRLNLLCAVVAILASLVWLEIGQNATVVVWLACALVWLMLALFGSRARTDQPIARLARRLLRLLVWS